MNSAFVSVLIPIKNEESFIQACLSRLLDQTYDKDRIEIIIIDGDSTDNSIPLIEQFKIQHPNLKIDVLYDHTQQRSSALNMGLKHASGDVLIRIDARTIIPVTYVEECVTTLIAKMADNVGGIQKPIMDSEMNIKQIAIAHAMSHPYGVGNAQFRVGKKSGYVDSVYLGCFRKSVFQKVGLFDDESPIISEDSDLNYRIRKKGGSVYLNTDIVAYYIPRDTFCALSRLYYRYGGARAGFLLKWKTLTSIRQLIPPILLLTLVVLFTLSFASKLSLLLLFYVSTAYLLASLFFSFTIAYRNRTLALSMPLIAVFIIMHMSWAYGFWIRILQGRRRKAYWGY